MNIYDEDGESVDLTLALAELRRSDGMTDPRRKATVAEISAAALLDIAGSLRILANESALAMGGGYLDVTTAAIDAEPDPGDDLIVEGNLVAAEGREAPGEVTRIFFTEGEHFADIAFADATMATLPLATLHRLVGDERDDDTMQDAAEIAIALGHMPEPPVTGVTLDDEGALLRGDDVEPEGDIEIADPADLVDDIDADFDGAVHPAAESALDLLKANEAARKAAKKSGPKKGSKK